MINNLLVISIISIPILLIALLILGYFTWKAIREITLPEKAIEELTKPFVTPTNPAFVNENQSTHEDSFIITPKSPQLVDWEENEQLRKMNIGRPR